MAVTVFIVDDSGELLDSFVAEPRVPTEEPLDTAHAFRDLISTVTTVTDTTPKKQGDDDEE